MKEAEPAPVDTRGRKLAGRSFCGRDLRGASFREADLRGVDFRGARTGKGWRLSFSALELTAIGSDVGFWGVGIDEAARRVAPSVRPKDLRSGAIEFCPAFFSLTVKRLSVSMNMLDKILTPFVTATLLCLGMAPGLAAAEKDCQDAVSTAEMQTCANELYQAADGELNRTYRQLAAQLSDKRRERLKAAQQAWIAFRDKNATFAASAVAGGTMYPILEVMEWTNMTKQRSEQLKAYLKE